MVRSHRFRCIRRTFVVAVIATSGLMGGCAVVAVTDAAVSVAATTVKAGASVAGATVDVARAGIRAVTPRDDAKK